jgi:hypothetical protein
MAFSRGNVRCAQRCERITLRAAIAGKLPLKEELVSRKSDTKSVDFGVIAPASNSGLYKTVIVLRVEGRFSGHKNETGNLSAYRKVKSRLGSCTYSS